MGTLNYYALSPGFLLDTHTFLWAVKDPDRLGAGARKIIEDPQNTLYLSVISAYEVTLKDSMGKLDASYALVVSDLAEIARRLGCRELPITLKHAWQAGRMDWRHRDPFDRMIAAQAALENLTLITNDAALTHLSSVKAVW